jgi:hypothetical protein
MFSKRIISGARFLKMPLSTQALYFHLGLNADDDGIVEAYVVMNLVGAAEDDLKVLVAKGFVTVLNDDLVTYINDWQENNRLRADRKIDSIYKPLLLKMLPDVELVEHKPRADLKAADDQRTASGRPVDNQRTTNGRRRLGKDRLGKDSVVKQTYSAKSASRTYAPDSDEYQLATKLWEKIKGNNPEAKHPNLQSWCNDIRLMHERDGRKWEQISNMIDWCQNDDFWQANILSAKKLREKYDQLKAQALRATNSANSKKRYGRPPRVEDKPDWAEDGYKAPTGEISAETKKQIEERMAILAASSPTTVETSDPFTNKSLRGESDD